MADPTEKQFNTLAGLFKERQELDERIKRALADMKRGKQATKRRPNQFVLSDVVLDIAKETGPKGVRALDVLGKVKEKHPDKTFTRRQITSAILHLTKEKKAMEKIGEGVYRIKSP